jgi:hypothetical protein
VFEIWHWENTTKFEDGEGGLFAKYVNYFLRLKQQASGYPSWVTTEEDKDRYIAEYFEMEGIKLDKDQIELDETKRTLAKVCLNSLWVKFLLSIIIHG